ncbi:hypothetical protein BC833DRAFT_607518 [Globomyces pollinis-pini]|nr:hypothetical protein BC833DRAFT_607518 [Globomyces pollinis-pini]
MHLSCFVFYYLQFLSVLCVTVPLSENKLILSKRVVHQPAIHNFSKRKDNDHDEDDGYPVKKPNNAQPTNTPKSTNNNGQTTAERSESSEKYTGGKHHITLYILSAIGFSLFIAGVVLVSLSKRASPKMKDLNLDLESNPDELRYSVASNNTLYKANRNGQTNLPIAKPVSTPLPVHMFQ